MKFRFGEGLKCVSHVHVVVSGFGVGPLDLLGLLVPDHGGDAALREALRQLALLPVGLGPPATNLIADKNYSIIKCRSTSEKVLLFAFRKGI